MSARWLLPLGLFLSACTVGPDYRRPDVALPGAFRGDGDGPSGDAASLVDRPWWETFGDETLRSLVDEALAGSFDVRAAAWRVAEYRARAGIARSGFFPQVGYDGAISRGRTSPFVLPAAIPRNLEQVSLEASWEVDLWGRVRRLSESARARYLATEEARRAVLLSVVSDVAEAYFGLLELDERLGIARRTTEAYRETFDLFSRREDGGMASALEVARAESDLRTASATVRDLEHEVVAQENLISLLLGRNPGPVPRGRGLSEQPLPTSVPAGLPSSLLDRRPDVREAEEELVSANADVGVALASFYPKVTLTGAFGGVSPAASDLLLAGRFWSLAAGLAGPLFEGLRLKYQYDATLALFEQGRVRYERSVASALGEVSTALSACRELAAAESERAGSVAAGRDAVRLANIRYAAGLSSYVEVLDAQQQLYPAEIALVATRRARLDALVTLYRALGGGWPMDRSETRGGSPIR